MSAPGQTRRSPETLEAWRYLLSPEGQSLLEAADSCQQGDVGQIAHLRRTWSQQQVSAALELSQARRRAQGKMANANSIVSDTLGLEQATGTVIATYKADRIHSLGIRQISDLCCGIGGDAMALSKTLSVIGMDSDPLKCWMTSVNADCPTECVDITDGSIPEGPIHIDPSRRDPDRSKRRHEPNEWSPSADYLKQLVQTHPDSVIKMGPGIDQNDLLFRPEGSEVEFISSEGHLLQAVLWTGCFQSARRRATQCDANGCRSLSSNDIHSPPVTATNWTSTWLHVPDPAVERAGLLGLLCSEWNLAEPAAGLGLLVGDQAADTPWLVPYEVADQIPWRVEKIKAWLKAHDGGPVEIRTRGRAVRDVDRLRNEFQGDGQTRWTVFGLRLGEHRVAVLTRPRNRDAAQPDSASKPANAS